MHIVLFLCTYTYFVNIYILFYIDIGSMSFINHLFMFYCIMTLYSYLFFIVVKQLGQLRLL